MKTYRIYFHRPLSDPSYCLRCYLSVKATNCLDALDVAESLKDEDVVVAVIDIEKAIISELKDYQCKTK